jgi:nitrite reductase/ring-hydroxylating ferredoxin subunit
MAKCVDIGSLDDFPPRVPKDVSVEGKSLLVVNLGEKLMACANICPHAGKPLHEGELAGTVLTCPFHGYAFDLRTGRNVDFPEDHPLWMYPIRQEAGRVIVELAPTLGTRIQKGD